MRIMPTEIDHTERLPFGLTVSGTMYAMGLARASTRERLTARGLMDLALELGLGGVEPPLGMLASEDVEALGAYATERGLGVVVDAGGHDPDELAHAVEVAARIGARVVRTTIGGAKIGGDRRPLAGRWQPFMDEVAADLTRAVAVAADHGITLAVENHQDVASEELLWLCDTLGTDHFGINLDAANPLGTAEEPLDFFRRVAPYVKNVHLKDYRAWQTEDGYRLVRCATGAGLTDFPALLDLLDAAVPGVPMALEIGALEARHIRVLAADFWPDYPPRTAAQLAAALQVVAAHAEEGEWRTPFERGESPEAIAAYEQEQLDASVAYLHRLQAGRHAGR